MKYNLGKPVNLHGSLWDSLVDSLWRSLKGRLWDSLSRSLGNGLGDGLWDSLQAILEEDSKR